VKGEWDLVVIASNLKFSVEEKMWEKFKSIYSQIKNKKPGHRFRKFYDKTQRKKKGPVKRILYGALGIILIIVGILLSIIPLVPGFIVVLIGLALLAGQSLFVASKLDKTEKKTREIIE